MLDCRHELDNMEAELKRIQQEVKRSRRMRRRRIKGQTCCSFRSEHCIADLLTAPTADYTD